MISNAEKRKFMRLGAFLEGEFEAEYGVCGLIMLTNFSKEGFKASVNRCLKKGQILKMEIWMPGSIIPVFAECKVVWTGKCSKEWTYDHDAGIIIEKISPEDRFRLMDFAYEYWRCAGGKQ